MCKNIKKMVVRGTKADYYKGLCYKDNQLGQLKLRCLKWQIQGKMAVQVSGVQSAAHCVFDAIDGSEVGFSASLVHGGVEVASVLEVIDVM